MSLLSNKLAKRDFVVTTELTPPKGIDISDLRRKAELLSECVDAFNLTDSHSSKMSLSPIATASCLLAEGIEPIVQVTTRDRNRIGLQSDMLGAALLGIQNIVCMGGDPPHLGDHPEAKPVFDISTIELIRAARQLSQGEDLMGNRLKGTPQFSVGAVVNPGVADLAAEISRLEDKVAAGATFFQTQAIFDPKTFADFMDQIAHLDIHIIAGIMPIKSAKMARFVNEKIPGIDVPDRVINMIDQAQDVVDTSSGIAADTIGQIKSLCSGVHLMALGAEAQIPTILERSIG